MDSNRTLEVKEQATVGKLKKAIAEQENLPIDRLILMRDAGPKQDQLQSDDFSLKDYGVQDGSKINIVFKPLVDNNNPQFPIGPVGHIGSNNPSSSGNVSK